MKKTFKDAFIQVVEKVAKLIDVKSGVTILLAAVFSILSLRGTLSGEQFLTIFTVIISFYYGTQYAKKGSGNDEGKDE